ncbi:hypothetical protein BJ138DRAFT_1142471 [Hygrophoropsis aurantiaca]|uniref:Uncharacterized protein n=1 Tax=Hygrophoropsis aurantiaca TaxID=72124 RepID=A0ACB8ANJ2_9AGAM|nr:hypothetical protein BJ138DRAFT_1142471 [Hygrophoropsis aurantiaca]
MPTIICKQCEAPRRFNDVQARYNHQRAVHPFCSLCDQAFYSEHGFEMHKASMHPIRYYCKSCGRNFQTSSGRDRHWDDMHAKYRCRECDRGFETTLGREAHGLAKHL